MALVLVIGDKHKSSWSLRPWLMLKRVGLVFEETLIRLDQPDTAERLRAASPSGRVPCLIEDGFPIWDSLAIIERINELAPDAGVWPADAKARSRARSVAAEMHSGFAALRSTWPMAFAHVGREGPRNPALDADVARIDAIWRDTRAGFGADGPFLFGAFCAVDAMFAPVVSRFKTYRGPIADPVVSAYVDAVWSVAEMVEWGESAKAEAAAA